MRAFCKTCLVCQSITFNFLPQTSSLHVCAPSYLCIIFTSYKSPVLVALLHFPSESPVRDVTPFRRGLRRCNSRSRLMYRRFMNVSNKMQFFFISWNIVQTSSQVYAAGLGVPVTALRAPQPPPQSSSSLPPPSLSPYLLFGNVELSTRYMCNFALISTSHTQGN